ncbi:MAG: glucosylceramidase [Spirochaetia bacterium]|nr:glucosylceramidase [Spirochaetia bacterium]
MKRFITDEKNNLIEEQIEFPALNGWVPNQLKISDKISYQKILGFGGALTEASAYVWSKMDDENKDKLLDLYFGEKNSGYNFCRLHIQSCDFALGNYAYIEDPSDSELKTFSLERDKKYIIPFVKAAVAKNPDIEFLASPWSPPAFMKTNNDMNHGGKLKEEFMEMWANVIAKYVAEYRKEGINITRLTVQNEPAATQTWDSCIYSAEEERNFACEYLETALKKASLSDVKINIWDHNKELLVERAIISLATEKAREKISGIAFHWYTGDYFEAVQEVSRMFPDKELIFTEGCVEYSVDKNGSEISRAERYAHDMIGNLNSGMNAFMDWNIILDEKGGPNHVGNFCDAPVMCNYEKNSFDVHKSYYYIRHFSSFIKKGAVRIFTTRSNDKIEVCAFKNPDGSKVAVILNKTDVQSQFNLISDEHCAQLDAPAHSIQTVVF